MPEWASFGAVAEVHLSWKTYFTSSHEYDQKPPLLSDLAPVCVYVHIRIKECFACVSFPSAAHWQPLLLSLCQCTFVLPLLPLNIPSTPPLS
jgi:hypothetical protein